MVVKIMQQIKAWSFSRWKDWKKCPAFAKYRFIDKWLPEGEMEIADTPVQARGQDAHNDAEKFTLGEIKVLPKSLEPFKEEFTQIRKSKPPYQTGGEWAFTKDWNKTEWFGTSAWCRVIMDLYKVKGNAAHVIDLKTGRKYPDDHKMQMELYAIATFIMYPKVNNVQVELWYTDLGEIETLFFERDHDLPILKRTWLLRVTPMMKDTRFAPRPGSYCRWCPYSKAKSGPCSY